MKIVGFLRICSAFAELTKESKKPHAAWRAIFYSVILNKSFGVQSKIWQRASMFSYLIALV